MPRIAIQRKGDGLLYLGTADREALFGNGVPCVFIDKEDAELRARGLGGAKWGELYRLVPAALA